MASKIWRAGVSIIAMVSAQDAPLFVENKTEFEAIKLGSRTATMKITTGWSLLGLNHAKEY